MAEDFEIVYTELDEDTKQSVRDDMAAPEVPPSRSKESLELEHFAHSLLRDKAIADLDAESQAAAESAMETIKAAIVAIPAPAAAKKKKSTTAAKK